MAFKWHKWLPRVALLTLCVFSIVALILSLVGIRSVALPPENKYGLVFDAGSSHTSLFVYQWPTDKENNTGVVSQTFSCHVNGSGISSYDSHPTEAGASLRPCLDEAMMVIPPERRREAPAYLGATAGMRLLRKKNPSVSERILEEVGKAIREYPVSFRGARIITGEDEGAYGWITINYLLNSFTQYSAKDRDWVHPASAGLVGALDLGGASTQISFLPSDNNTDPFRFRLYGFDYGIYTHSYLCYGQNQALDQVIRVILNASSSDVIEHPCYPQGYNGTMNVSSLFGSACANNQTQAPGNVTQVLLLGTGNATLCRQAVRNIFNFSNCSHSKSCGFNGVYQPRVNGKFLAFSAYYYTFSFLNLTETHPLAVVEDAIDAFCSRTWNDLKSSYSDQTESRLVNYCASANYILTLLLDGYGFSNTSWENIAFRMQVANSDIGWTLGYMLNLTNMIPSEAPRTLRGHEEGPWVASVFFIVATLALAIVLLLIYFLQ
nr:PREDICTED: ectonucleoside triphosphate diphosphohydrolase 8 [Anolis carolinensis]|eukprot:XP_008122527.1 PREDICTED: ectonucleoside triphosphate diphosphohydrolase 8 [Anolis carolinensis]